MLTIHDSQPAKESHCLWVGQSAAAFGWSRHWSVASPVSMRRSATKRTHWKFDVQNVRRDFLDNNWDNKHAVSVVNFFKCVVTKVVLFLIVILKILTLHKVVYWHTLGVVGSVVTILLQIVYWFWQWKIWKFVNIWRSYELYKNGAILGPPYRYRGAVKILCIIMKMPIVVCRRETILFANLVNVTRMVTDDVNIYWIAANKVSVILEAVYFRMQLL